VALRPVRQSDIERAFAALHRRHEILEWLVWRGPERREDLERYYESWCQAARSGPERAGHDYHLAVIDLESELFAGSLSLRFAWHPGVGDLGYWIAVDSWNRGFGSEAIRLASWLGFGPLRAHLIRANVFSGNHASRRVLEKSGYSVDREVAIDHGEGKRTQWCLNATRRSFLAAVGDWSPVHSRVELNASPERGAG
jgi:RimJ/RimL family protein N-acetyltransferase